MAIGKTKRQLQNMEPDQFEELVAEIWRNQGYNAKVTKTSGDRGIDVEATRQRPTGNEKILIQAKCYSSGNTVGSQDVRNYATLYQQEDDVDSVVIVTSSKFTTQAKELAKDLNVETIGGRNLVNIIENNGINHDKYVGSGISSTNGSVSTTNERPQTRRRGNDRPTEDTDSDNTNIKKTKDIITKTDRLNFNKTPNLSVNQMVDQASGSVDEDKLLNEYRGQKPYDFLIPKEKIEYMFTNESKGFRIIEPDGEEKTPDHEIGGVKHLIISNKQICYIFVKSLSDIRFFDYDNIVNVKSKTGMLRTPTLTFELSDGTKYRFAGSKEVTDAAEYIESKI